MSHVPGCQLAGAGIAAEHSLCLTKIGCTRMVTIAVRRGTRPRVGSAGGAAPFPCVGFKVGQPAFSRNVACTARWPGTDRAPGTTCGRVST